MNFIIRYILFFIILISFQNNNLLAQKKPKFKKANKEEKAQLAEYAFSEGMKRYILGNFPQALSYFEESKKLGGDNAALNYVQAKIYIYKDRPDIALQFANKALKMDPQNKYYYLLVAEIYESKQNYAEALKVYKKLIADIPHNEEYNYNLGEIYYFQKNYEEALKTYSKIETLFGKSLPLTERKQDIFEKTNHLDLAIKEGESLINAFPDDAEYKVSQADFLFKNNQSEKAISLLEDVLKTNPEEAYARLLLSTIYQAQGNKDKADRELEVVFNSTDTDLDTKISIIGNYLNPRSKDYNVGKAVQFSESTVKLYSTESKAYAIYGEALMHANKKEEGWKSFVKAIELDKSNFNLWIQVLSMDMDLNKPDSVVQHSEEALEVFPNQAALWLYNGWGYSLKKNYKRAIEALEDGKKLSSGNPDLLLQFNTQLADNYNSTKEYPKSDAAFEEVLKLDPDNDHVLNNYSYFLSIRKEKLELAKKMSEKLIKRYPNESNYLDTYAWVLYQMKNFEEAKKYLEIAALKSDNGTILEHYGDTLYQLGEKELALEQWKKAQKLGDTSDFLDKKIADKKIYE